MLASRNSRRDYLTRKDEVEGHGDSLDVLKKQIPDSAAAPSGRLLDWSGSSQLA
jgi:hypothetical protein